MKVQSGLMVILIVQGENKMMSRQDYIAIAKVFNKLRQDMPDPMINISVVEYELCKALKNDNANFKIDRFLEFCREVKPK